MPEFQCDLVLNEEDALFAANKFSSYYQNFGDMSDYLRQVKLQRVAEMPQPLFGMSMSDDFFQDWDMSPNDMNFRIVEPDLDTYNSYLEITTSHALEKSIPGRKVILMIYETNTNKIVGFIRLSSPMMNVAPRNKYFEEVLGPEAMPVFNRHAIMGFTIVPTQPFGYNCLGGKLLALLCCSHEVKQIVDQKYDMDLCFFETTSLYGSSKSMSQYDGLKPFIKGQGLTESNFAPLINDEHHRNLEKFFREKNNGEPIVWDQASSRKMKAQAKMIGIIKKSLKDVNPTEYKKFVDSMEFAKSLQERKRYYVSDLGFSNVKEVITGKTDKLIKKENYDRFSMDNLVDWWKKKATNRHQTLLTDGRLRRKLEVWNENPEEIDIIR